MREIKYRVWDKTEKRMVYDGEPFMLITNHGVFKLDPHLKENRYYLVDVPIERMQYTGLQDKAGKDIYEGDIVQDEDGQNGVFMYDDSAAGYFLSYVTGASFVVGVLEVIGNIYENPELKGE